MNSSFFLNHLFFNTKAFLREHYSMCFTYFDPVKKHLSSKNSRLLSSATLEDADDETLSSPYKFHFAFAFIYYQFVFLDGIFGLYYEGTSAAGNDEQQHFLFSFVFSNWSSVRHNFFHQIAAKEVLFQSDVIMFLNHFTVSGIFALMGAFKSNWPEELIYLPVTTNDALLNLQVGNMILPSKLSSSILAASKRGQRSVRLVTSTFIFGCLSFCYKHVLFHNRADLLMTPHSLFFWFALFPLYFIYSIHFLMTFMIFVILTAKYLRLRQASMLASFKSLLLNDENRKEKFSSTLLWVNFFALNRAQVEQCAQISGYARFWAPFLSAVFPYYILNICYLAFLALLDESVPFHNRYIYAAITVQMAPFFLALIEQCAASVRLNGAISGQCRRAYVLFSRQIFFNESKRKIKSTKSSFSAALLLLKAETFQDARRFHPYAFKVLPMRARITSRTFHSLFIYISIVFLDVYKQKYNLI